MLIFKITDGKGFQITFANGVTLSTQFGQYNYCENYILKKGLGSDLTRAFGKENHCPNCESKDVEIAIWKGRNDEWLTRECPHCEVDDDVMGYVNIDTWFKIVEWCKDYKG